MAKYVQFEFSDGAYRIPVEIIATNRAEYYVDNDTEGMQDSDNLMYLKQDIFVKEYNSTMQDNYEAIDWLRNNMDYEDLAGHMFLYKIIEPKTHREQWQEISSEGLMRIVDEK